MTAPDPMHDLARRAVACPRWRWMDGMLTLDGDRMSDVGWPEYGELDTGSCGVVETVEWRVRAKRGALPDLSDPATLGCLLALVREAWGDPEMHLALGGAGWVWMSSESRIADVVLPIPAAHTEAGALIAALEVAP